MRVIKYNPKTEEFTEEVVNSLEDYSKLLECKYFDIVAYTDNLTVYVDDEGAFKTGNIVTTIQFPDGRNIDVEGIILFAGGIDGDGEQLGFDGSIEELKAMVVPTDSIVRWEG